MSDQQQLPLRRAGAPTYTLEELVREARLCKSFGAAVMRCGTLAGFDLDKEAAPAGMDKARWSRIGSGREGILWPQLQQVMDECGNDLPMVWIGEQRKWDMRTLRRQENYLERKLRESEERAEREKQRADAAEGFVAGVISKMQQVAA